MSFLAFILIVIVARPKEEKNPPQTEEEVLEGVRNFNNSVSAITSISCDVYAIGTKTEIVYIKPSKVLAVTSSPFGKKQAEVATDGMDYWFWVKDFDRTSIYHCPLSKISATRVILPMRPNIVTSVIGIDEIRWESISMQEGTAQLTCSEDDLIKCVFFRNGNIAGFTYRIGESPIMTATFKSHQNISGFEIPRDVNVIWHEQNESVDFRIEDAVINIKNPPEIKMPEGMKKVSLIGL